MVMLISVPLKNFNFLLYFTYVFILFKGALCFVISDSILSFDMFIYDVPYSHPIIMLTYYAAQLGISLSVVDSYEPRNHDVNHLVIQHSDLIRGVRTIYSQMKSACFEENITFVELSSSQEKTGTTSAPLLENIDSSNKIKSH